MIHLRTSIISLVALACAATAAAQEVGVSAAIAAVHYDVTFNEASARHRSVQVAMSFDVIGPEPVLLSLPAWTPGSYSISYFARRVNDFGAAQDGSTIRWNKADHDTWRVHPAGRGRVTVSFRYLADTLNNAMSWSSDDFLLFNGTNLFMYPEGQGADWRATVTIHTEPEWQVGTAMPKADTPDGRTYVEQNYHDLVDHPFFIGRLEIDSSVVAGRWMRLVTYPVGSVSGPRRQWVWDGLRAMTPPAVAIFGDVPWQAYNVMQIADTNFRGASGLEHKDSHVNIVVWRALDHPVLLSLYAHEIVHAWNVKRLRPAGMVPYVYHTEQPTPLLWVSEGITDYYADLMLVRGRLTDSVAFLRNTSEKILNVQAVPPISMEDASLRTWIAPLDGTHHSYYDHGSVAGLLLDVLIRDGSDNARSLDHVMRELYETTYKRGRGFTREEWWSAVERNAGRSLADFRARYVEGRERLPYATVLPLAGIAVTADTARQIRLGVLTALEEGGIQVQDVEPGSAAAQAGVRRGDYLLAVGDVRITEDDFGAGFRARYAGAAPGTPLLIRVRRDGAELDLPGELRVVEDVTHRLSWDARADTKASRIRASLLRGSDN